MAESYNMPNHDEDKIKQLLNDLPKHSAPIGFDEKLMTNIRRIENGEDVSLIQTGSSNWIVKSISAAAGIACAFVLFNVFDGAPAQTMTDQMATTPIETKIDSTKEVPQTSPNNVNLVKDKK